MDQNTSNPTSIQPETPTPLQSDTNLVPDKSADTPQPIVVPSQESNNPTTAPRSMSNPSTKSNDTVNSTSLSNQMVPPPLVNTKVNKSKAKLILILLGISVVLFGGVFYYLSTTTKPQSSTSSAYEKTKSAISKASEEMKQLQANQPKQSALDTELNNIDQNMTQIDQENELADQGIKDTLPDLTVQ